MVYNLDIDRTGLAIARVLYREELRCGRPGGVSMDILEASFGREFAERYAHAGAPTLEAYLCAHPELFDVQDVQGTPTASLRSDVKGYVMHARDEPLLEDFTPHIDHGYLQATSAPTKRVLGQMSFHEAVLKGVLAVQLVLAKGLRDINERNAEGLAPLMVAAGVAGLASEEAAAAALEVVKLLVDNGAALAMEDNRAWTATCYAASSGNTQILDYIRKQGGALGQRTLEGDSLLHVAAANRYPDTLRLLLDYLHADVHSVNAAGETALHLAADAGCAECTTLLTGAMAHSHSLLCGAGTTAAHRAARRGYTPCLAAVVAADPAAVHVLSSGGRHPIHDACVSGVVGCVAALLEAQCVFIPDADGRTPLHIASEFGYSDCLAELLQALTNGAGTGTAAATIDHRANGGWTALHEACKADSEPCVGLLLDASCRADVGLDADGFCAVHTAAAHNSARALAVILGRCPQDVDRAAEGGLRGTPLLAACERNSLHAAVVLLAAGAAVNARDARGNTAFHYAAKAPVPKLFEALCGAEGLHSTTLGAVNDEGEVLGVMLRRGDVGESEAAAVVRDMCDECNLALLQSEELAEREATEAEEQAEHDALEAERLTEYNACCLAEEMQGYVDHRTFTYEELKLPGSVLDETHINVAIREFYLSDEEFVTVFGVEKDRYRGLSQHKKDAKKKEVGLLAIPEEEPKPAA